MTSLISLKITNNILERQIIIATIYNRGIVTCDAGEGLFCDWDIPVQNLVINCTVGVGPNKFLFRHKFRMCID